MVKLLYWAGCTALAGEKKYSRNPLPGSYLGSSEESGVYTFELQGICNKDRSSIPCQQGVYTLELQGICNSQKLSRKAFWVFTPLNCKGYATHWMNIW